MARVRVMMRVRVKGKILANACQRKGCVSKPVTRTPVISGYQDPPPNTSLKVFRAKATLTNGYALHFNPWPSSISLSTLYRTCSLPSSLMPMIASNPPLPLVYTSNIVKNSTCAIAMVAESYKINRLFLPDGGGWVQQGWEMYINVNVLSK